jgi:hypothetical protein
LEDCYYRYRYRLAVLGCYLWIVVSIELDNFHWQLLPIRQGMFLLTAVILIVVLVDTMDR